MSSSIELPVSYAQTLGRPGLDQAIDNSFTMAYRGLLKVARTPEQLFDVTVQPIIFTLMFSYLFGGAISGNVRNYLPVVIPGILVQTVIGASIVTGVQLREDMDKGVFNRFKSLPIARISPLVGALASADGNRLSGSPGHVEYHSIGCARYGKANRPGGRYAEDN